MMSRHTRVSLALLSALLFSACQSAPAPKPAPPTGFGLSMRHFPGPLLSGKGAGRIGEKELYEALQVSVEFRVVEAFPAEALQPLAPYLRLVLGSNQLLRPSPMLFAGARFAPVRDIEESLGGLSNKLGRVQNLRQLSGILPQGASARFDLTREVGGSLPASRPERLSLILHRVKKSKDQDDRLQLALECHDNRTTSGSSEGLGSLTETVVLEDHKGTNSSYLFLVKQPFSTTSQSVAIAVKTLPTPTPGQQGFRAFSTRVAEVKGQLTVPNEVGEGIEPGGKLTPRVVEVSTLTYQALSQPARRRRVLEQIGRQAGASLLTELALTARPTVIAQLATELEKALKSMPPQATPKQWAWRVEIAAFTVVNDLFLQGQLPLEVLSVTLRYAGGVASQPSIFVELVEASRDLEELREGLIAKNRELLSDAECIVRIRAYNWLRARKLHPKNFQPLGPEDERRRAIEAAEKIWAGKA